MEYGRVLERRVDVVLWDLDLLARDGGSLGSAREIWEIKQRLMDVRRAIYRQPGELIGSDFVAQLNETCEWARDRIAAIRRTP